MNAPQKAAPAAKAKAAKGAPQNKMREPFIEKVVVNIGVGDSGEKLAKAEKVLSLVTNRKPSRTFSKVTNRDFGIRAGQPIGCKVTLRGPDAEKFVKNVLWIKENRILDYSFDDNGNLSIGVSDYTDFPGMKYDPNIGIYGMDVCVCIKRAGARISQRRRCRTKLPRKQKVKYTEAMDIMKKKFNVEVV